MSEEPYGVTVFCDDIREEVSGKISLIGCYGAEINILGAAPAALPMFCAFVNFRGPTNLEFSEIAVVITTQFGDQITELGRVNFPKKDEANEDMSESKYLGITVPFKFAPLLVPSDGFVRSRAYIDSREVKLGSISVLLKDPESEKTDLT